MSRGAEPRGLIVPLVTPARNGSIDFESLSRLAGILSGRGAQLFPVSTTGEAVILGEEDRVRVVERVVEASRTPVWAGTGANSVEANIRLAKKMIDAGATGIVVVTPYYYRVSQEALYRYYTEILSRVDAPVIAYTIPSAACNRLEPETVERLAEEHGNLVGVKVTSEDAGYLASMMIALRGVHTRILPGSVPVIPVARAYGATGAILAIGNILPLTTSKALTDTPDWHAHYRLLARAYYVLERSPGPCHVKSVLARLGLIQSPECLGPLRYETPPEPPEWLVEEAERELLH